MPQIASSNFLNMKPFRQYMSIVPRFLNAKDARDAKMENEISHKIIGAAIEVHKILGGAGLLESI